MLFANNIGWKLRGHGFAPSRYNLLPHSNMQKYPDLLGARLVHPRATLLRCDNPTTWKPSNCVNVESYPHMLTLILLALE